MARASVPVLGAVVLVGVTVVLAVAVGAALTGSAPAEPTEQVALSLEADATTGRVALEHLGGPPLDVRDLALRVAVDGEPLAHQPPVPFVGARGFDGAPTGPFNPATDPTWSVGETAAFRVAGTNAPALTPGARLVVSVVRDGRLVARVTTHVD